MKVVRIDEGLATAAPAPRPEPNLSLVPAASPAERARQLMREARAMAGEQLSQLIAALEAARGLAAAVAEGGDLYGVGVRELAGRLAEDLAWKGKSLEALGERERRGQLAH